MLRLALFGAVAILTPLSIAHAQDGLPPNTIDCAQFVKTGPTEWNEVGTAVFDLGSSKHTSMSGSNIPPHAYNIGGYDLYDVLEKKCGGK